MRGEDAELGVVRLAAEDLAQALELLLGQADLSGASRR